MQQGVDFKNTCGADLVINDELKNIFEVIIV